MERAEFPSGLPQARELALQGSHPVRAAISVSWHVSPYLTLWPASCTAPDQRVWPYDHRNYMRAKGSLSRRLRRFDPLARIGLVP